MPGQCWLHLAGGHYHVMGRGLERRYFKETADKKSFILRLADGLERTGAECLAWALMGNQYHLLIRASQSSAKVDAAEYNRRHHRVGDVFQNRYKK